MEEAHFRDIYSGINWKWYRRSWKEFEELKNIEQNFYCSNYFDGSVNEYGVKCYISLRFWENKGWINFVDSYVWFQWYFKYWLGRGSSDNKRQNNRWKEILSRFKGKLVKIKDINS